MRLRRIEDAQWRTLVQQKKLCALRTADVRDAEQREWKARREFGELVRFVREYNGISLRELARRCGVSAAMLSDFERGHRWSTPLADALAMRLIGNDGEPGQPV